MVWRINLTSGDAVMTPEQRFDRLERIVKLMIKAGLRGRRQMREQDQKLGIIIDAQIRNEERFARNEERFAKLTESQTHTAQRLDALIDIIREGRNGTLSA
jgi:hypothetical protein